MTVRNVEAVSIISNHISAPKDKSTRMTTFKSDFLNVLSSRASSNRYQPSERLIPWRRKAITAYIGFDCRPFVHVAASSRYAAVLAPADRTRPIP